MASRRVERSFAFALSIAVHAAIVVALTFSVSLGDSRPTQQVVIPIDTIMVDESAVRAEMARLEAEEQARIRAQEEAERRAREEADRARREQEEQQRELDRIRQEREQAELAAEQERIRLEAEAQARAEQEREQLRIQEEERIAREAEEARIEAERLEQQRLEAERLERERIAEEERRREEERREAERLARIAAIEAETQRAIAAEQAARAAADAGLRDQWARQISDKVQRNWRRPPNVEVGLECALEVTQLPNGEVINVTTDRCNTNDQTIIRSIENAVANASPLPPAPPGVAFDRFVIITFRPDD
jgi:colicin import membrane protein